MATTAKSKNAWRRAQAKAKKSATAAEPEQEASATATVTEESKDDVSDKKPTLKPAPGEDTYDFDNDDFSNDPMVGIDDDNPLYQQFKSVFARFADPVEVKTDKPEIFYDNDDDIPEEERDENDEDGDREPTLSRRKRKEQNKLSIAQLKATVRRPELVEWTDVSSSDPRLLLAIKSHRNVVPVPAHWSLKREYLSSKRGIEKAPFQLPRFIQDTGITEMRDAVLEKQAEQSLKQKQRERVQPKLGRLDIDYQRLYEAFFRFQTKPELTRYGEVYYEGKEFETNMKHLRPGELSEELKEALNMPDRAPPPWLINQQRFGPPPSYPALKIPGLNAPPPPGAEWGFHPGGYGKPPVDEFNRPLYGGDIFGVMQPQEPEHSGEPVEKTLWGEIEEPEEEEEEEEDSDDDDDESDGDGDRDMDEDMVDVSGRVDADGPAVTTNISEYGGTESVAPEFSLRQHRTGAAAAAAAAAADSEPARSAYQIIPERAVRAQGFFGTDRVYDLQGAGASSGGPGPNVPVLGHNDSGDRPSRRHHNRADGGGGDVDVAVDLDALERDSKLTKDELRRQYDEARKTEQGQSGWNMHEDLSNMIAEESQKRRKKDDERREARRR